MANLPPTVTEPSPSSKNRCQQHTANHNKRQQANQKNLRAATTIYDKLLQATTSKRPSWNFGKDEVASSNLASSSKKTGIFGFQSFFHLSDIFLTVSRRIYVLFRRKKASVLSSNCCNHNFSSHPIMFWGHGDFWPYHTLWFSEKQYLFAISSVSFFALKSSYRHKYRHRILTVGPHFCGLDFLFVFSGFPDCVLECTSEYRTCPFFGFHIWMCIHPKGDILVRMAKNFRNACNISTAGNGDAGETMP